MADQYLCTIAEARAHLRMDPDFNDDDDMLQNIFIPAAANVIKSECGDILPQQYDESYDGGDYSVWTRHTPVLDVLNVQEGWGFTNYELTYVQVNSTSATNMFAYSLDQPDMGQISRRTGGNVNIPFMRGISNIRVTYVAGRQEIPAAVKLAGLELVAHWYQGSQQRQAQFQSSGYDQVDTAQPTSGAMGGLIGINVGVPIRILELLRPYRHLPYIG